MSLSSDIGEALGWKAIKPRNNDLGGIIEEEQQAQFKLEAAKRMNVIEKMSNRGLDCSRAVIRFYRWTEKALVNKDKE